MRIDTSALRKSLAFVSPFTQSGGTIPIYGTIHLQMTDGGLILEASDARSFAQAVPVPAIGSLDLCVSAALLRGFCDRAGDQVELKESNGTLTLRSGKLKASLRALPGSDFPPSGKSQAVRTTIKGVNLTRMLKSVVAACAKQDIRGWPNGVLLQSAEGRLSAVGTDGGMLLACSVEHEADPGECIVPADIVERLPEVQSAEILEAGILFQCEGGTVQSSVIGAQCPNWQRVAHEKLPNRFTCKTADFRDALEATKPFQIEDKGNLKGKLLRFECDGLGTLVLIGGDEGESLEAHIECTGETATLTFRAGYWHELMRHELPEDLEIQFNERGQFAVKTDAWIGVIGKVMV